MELQPRAIEVHSLHVVRYDYPELVLEIECSGGTYVRSLGRDLAESLGTAAVMSALVGTAIGPWTVATAVDPRALAGSDWRTRLDPLGKALSDLTTCELTPADVVRVRQGLFISVAAPPQSLEIAAVDTLGRLVAILVPRGSEQWGPAKNFEP